MKREEVFLHFRAKAAAKREAVTMLHFGEVFSVEIYARGGIVVGGVKRAEGSRETMGFTRRFLSHFLFAVEKKVKTFP